MREIVTHIPALPTGHRTCVCCQGELTEESVACLVYNVDYTKWKAVKSTLLYCPHCHVCFGASRHFTAIRMEHPGMHAEGIRVRASGTVSASKIGKIMYRDRKK